MQPPTNAEIEEARNCDIEGLSTERYTDKSSVEDLSTAYAPQSACDWAVFAYACAKQSTDDSQLPKLCLDAFAMTAAENPAFMFKNQIFLYYFNSVPVVKAPPLSQKTVVALTVDYSWNGLGDDVEYAIEITQADSTPVVNVAPPTTYSASPEEIKGTIQSIPESLTDLLPISSPMSLTACFDNYPSWEVSLTFEDENVITLTNNNSNLLNAGGPWQTEIDGQYYVQFSAGFLRTLDGLIQQLGLGYGQPAAMYCNFETDLLDLAYP